MEAHPAGTPDRRDAWRMFEGIAPRYDVLNHTLSLGIDLLWRRRVAHFLPPGGNLRLLDLATGTGAQLAPLWATGRLSSAVGLDRSPAMLDRARRRIARLDRAEQVELREGDAGSLPFPGASFDAVTIAFGIRNMENVGRVLREMRRVLKPSGRALVLEFSLPSARPIRAAYLAYLRHVVPVIGGWITGRAEAVRYLDRTIETFPYGEAFAAELRGAGFAVAAIRPLSFGIATLYIGTI